jgi:hypothetical protein
MAYLDISRAFRDGNFSNLVQLSAIGVKALSESKAQRESGRAPHLPDLPIIVSQRDPTSLIEHYIIYALITLASMEKPISLFLSEWKDAAMKIPNSDSLVKSINQIEAILECDMSEVYKTYQDINRKGIEIQVAMIRMSSEIECSLAGMFVGQASLLLDLSNCEHKEILEHFGYLVKNMWLKRTSFASEFSTPRQTIPDILSACNEQVTGLKLAARILLQARFAVSVSLGNNMIEQIKNLAK